MGKNKSQPGVCVLGPVRLCNAEMRAFLRYRVSLLVLEATDRRCTVHGLGRQEGVIDALVQRHDEGVVAIKIVDIRFYDSLVALQKVAM